MAVYERTLSPPPSQPAQWPAQGEWTYEDYCRLPDDGWRYEVIKGVLYMTPAPQPRHQIANGNLHFAFRRFLQKKPVGKVFLAPVDLILPCGIGTPVQPDLLFIAQDDLDIVGSKRIEGAPALIVEVLSPSNWMDDRRDKFVAYAEAGVPEYWIVDPDRRTIEVFVLRAGEYELLGKFGPGERVRSRVLEGFAVAVDDVFAL